jgi:hypothetical protein
VTGPKKVTGDADGALEPGELWRYRCTHKVTGGDPDPFWNTAKVTGVDAIGREPRARRDPAAGRRVRLDLGAHGVTARVVFRTVSATRPRTLAMSFQRCAAGSG